MFEKEPFEKPAKKPNGVENVLACQQGLEHRFLGDGKCHKAEKRVERLAAEIKKYRRSEKALQESVEKYRSLFDNAIGGMFQSAPDGNIFIVNSEFARILGYASPRELMEHGKGRVEQYYVDPEQRKEWIRRVKKEGIVRRFEAEMSRKDGSIASVLINAMGDLDDAGHIRYLAGSIEDISALKKLELEQKKIEKQMVRSRKLESVGTLAGGIAHDFNNILTSVIGFAELAKLDLDDPDSEPRRCIEQVIKAGMRAKDLVRHLLVFSRLSEAEKSPIRLSPLVQEVAQRLEASLPSAIKVRVDVNDGDAAVLADTSQIRQLVINLCLNAAHAMAGDGGELGIRLEKKAFSPGRFAGGGQLSTGDCIVLEVSDTGPGIAPEIRDKIFDPFFTTKPRGEGTGMGLAVVHGIVKEMNGAIRVQSDAGKKGTLFSIAFPACGDAAGWPGRSGGTDPERGLGRILWVDDEPGIFRDAVYLLEKSGYKVTTRAKSQDALALFAADSHGFDLVITDLEMPGLSGLAFSRKILEIRPGLPILLCTEFASEIDRNRLEEKGICEMVMKPIIFSDLADAVNHALL